MLNVIVGALANNGSFGFAEGSACVSGKTKCAICAVGKIKNTEG